MSIYLLVYFLSTVLYTNSNNAILVGTILDANSKEVLPGAYVSINSEYVATDEYGQFKKEIAINPVHLHISYVGYEDIDTVMTFARDTQIVFNMTPLSLPEILVTEKQEARLGYHQLDKIRMLPKDIEFQPQLLGEADVLKSLTILPGISQGTEGTTGLFVRGGTPDQNLILLDKAIVFNPNHLFGFLSVFNPDALQEIEVYKGGFPAKYGGKLSSILDLSVRQGDKTHTKGSFTLSTIASKVALEGPLSSSDKWSYQLNGRYCYLGIVSTIINSRYKQGKQPERVGYSFYDGYLKLHGNLSKGITLSSQLFYNHDIYSYEDKTFDKGRLSINWGNLVSSTQLHTSFNHRLFATTTVYYSKYDYSLNYTSTESSQDLNTRTSFINTSHLGEYGLKMDLDQYVNEKYQLNFGVQWQNTVINPSNQITESSGTTYNHNYGHEQIAKYNVYGELHYQPTHKLEIHTGLRGVGAQLSDTTFLAIEPRIRSTYQIKADQTASIAFSIMHQWDHLIANSALGLPNDIWLPASRQLPPQVGYQIQAGWSKLLDKYNLSIEAYYKQMNHQIAVEQGIDFVVNPPENINSFKRNGVGKTYGVEALLEKKSGSWHGTLSYVLSWNWRKFTDLNAGNWYPFRYDRRHDIAISNQLQGNNGWSYGINWVFQSGGAFTLPESTYPSYQIDGDYISVYKSVNQYRLPSYHRLDLSFKNTKIKSSGNFRVWSFDIYNAYNRKNTYYLSLQNVSVYDSTGSYLGKVQQIKNISLFPVIPSISYKYIFK